MWAAPVATWSGLVGVHVANRDSARLAQTRIPRGIGGMVGSARIDVVNVTRVTRQEWHRLPRIFAASRDVQSGNVNLSGALQQLPHVLPAANAIHLACRCEVDLLLLEFLGNGASTGAGASKNRIVRDACGPHAPVLVASTHGAPQIAPGLLAWMQHAADNCGPIPAA